MFSEFLLIILHLFLHKMCVLFQIKTYSTMYTNAVLMSSHLQ